MGVGFFGKLFSKGSKVSPTITSVKPSTTVTKKGVKESLKKTRSEEYRKRYTALDKAESKVKTGKKMMQEGQKERKRMVDTGRAFQFKHSKSFHAVKPGEKRDTSLMKKPKKEKRFYTGKELEQQDYFNKGKGREKKMGGGMMGRRFGMKSGTPFKKETSVDKIKKAFPVTKKGLKKIDPEKQKGLAKLKKARPDVVRKMGYFKRGGRS